MIIQLDKVPPGWAIGLSAEGAVTAVFYFPREGWFDGYWITREGEECESVDIDRFGGVPSDVRIVARCLHIALGRPCTWGQT
jgi:hypothetical protein